MKVFPSWQRQLIATVRQGYAMSNAAAVVGIGLASVLLACKFDPEFAARLADAEADGLLLARQRSPGY